MAAPELSPEKQIAGFLAKFEPAVAKLIRQCRAEVRRILPTANELVWDNYNFFVIGYSPTERPSDSILSIAAAANGVGLSFFHGASVPDPKRLLIGEGKQNRFVRLPTAAVLRSPDVVALVLAAAKLSPPLSVTGPRRTIIRSISAKQRPRKRLATKAVPQARRKAASGTAKKKR